MAVQRPYMTLHTGLTQDEYTEDSEHGFTDIPRAWQDVGGGICKADNRNRAKILRVVEDAGAMFRVQI